MAWQPQVARSGKLISTAHAELPFPPHNYLELTTGCPDPEGSTKAQDASRSFRVLARRQE